MVVEEALAGNHLKVIAFAGAGKTFTLLEVAKALKSKNPHQRILYLTFNKALANEAKAKFGNLAEARTNHALARLQSKDLINNRKIVSSLLQLKGCLANHLPRLKDLQEFGYREDHTPFLVLETLNNFLYSRAPVVTQDHIPELIRLQAEQFGKAYPQLVELLVQLAQEAWDLLTAPLGSCSITHDIYLKYVQINRARINYDVILFDEAQDANPAMLDILLSQDVQRILVGDPHQQIYAWRGAVNAMLQVDGRELFLSQSFRFTEEIAQRATRLLRSFKGEKKTIRGIPNPETKGNRAILSRTNAGAIQEALDLLAKGYEVALVKADIDTFKEALNAAYQLFKGKTTNHPEFSLFRSWEALEDLIQRFPSVASQYRPYKGLVEKHGDDLPKVLRKLDRLKTERGAEVMVSTAHRSKGRQWTEVTLGADYEGVVLAQENPGHGCVTIFEDEVNLLYVAMTRAQTSLNLGSFAERLEQQVFYAEAVQSGRQRPCLEDRPGEKLPKVNLIGRLLRVLGFGRKGP